MRHTLETRGCSHDATFIVRSMSVPSWNGSTLDFGAIAGSLWLWSERDRKFACSANVELPNEQRPNFPRDEENRTLSEQQNLTMALKLRAIARALVEMQGASSR
jgi:hypothetical protein